MAGDAHGGLGPDFSVLNMTLADVEHQLGATGQQLGSMNVVRSRRRRRCRRCLHAPSLCCRPYPFNPLPISAEARLCLKTAFTLAGGCAQRPVGQHSAGDAALVHAGALVAAASSFGQEAEARGWRGSSCGQDSAGQQRPGLQRPSRRSAGARAGAWRGGVGGRCSRRPAAAAAAAAARGPAAAGASAGDCSWAAAAASTNAAAQQRVHGPNIQLVC